MREAQREHFLAKQEEDFGEGRRTSPVWDSRKTNRGDMKDYGGDQGQLWTSDKTAGS